MVENQKNNNIIEMREEINDFDLNSFDFEEEENFLNIPNMKYFEENEDFKYESINEYNNEKINNIFVKEHDTNFVEYIENLYNINREYNETLNKIKNIISELIMKNSGKFKKKIEYNLNEIEQNYNSNLNILKNKPLKIKENMKSIFELKNSLYYFIHEMENDLNNYYDNIIRFEKKIENLKENIKKLKKENKKFENKFKKEKMLINEEENKIEDKKNNLEYNIEEIEKSKILFNQINDLKLELENTKLKYKTLEEETIKLKNSKLYTNDNSQTIQQSNTDNTEIKEYDTKNKILEKYVETIKNNNENIFHSLNINQLNFFLFIIFNFILILKIINKYIFN